MIKKLVFVNRHHRSHSFSLDTGGNIKEETRLSCAILCQIVEEYAIDSDKPIFNELVYTAFSRLRKRKQLGLGLNICRQVFLILAYNRYCEDDTP